MPEAPPPSYQEAVATGSTPSRLQVPHDSPHVGSGTDSDPSRIHSSMPSPHRRSMQDESRDLPPGWLRQYDPSTHHQFYVDTRADPPRSMWHHPYDDQTFLATLSPGHRARIDELNRLADADDGDYFTSPRQTPHARSPTTHHSPPSPSYPSDLPPRPPHSPSSSTEKPGFGTRLKDRLTGTTHAQRETHRAERQKQEEEMYRRHLHIRRCMAVAMRTGQPQPLGKDAEGRDVFLAPPNWSGGPTQSLGRARERYVNPWAQGPYGVGPSGRYIGYPPPGAMYGRSGYGGMGLPLAGGLLGGAMLGGLLF